MSAARESESASNNGRFNRSGELESTKETDFAGSFRHVPSLRFLCLEA